ncbi:MAG: DUF4157 domain-containing protein [Bacteroidia bacterium]|nr:DUF4157 domain-containing protein [Bacteroidia bacterium]
MKVFQEMADQHVAQRFSVSDQRKEAAPVGKGSDGGLPAGLRSGIEGLSGLSMDGVKVHYNSDRPAQLQAHAFAQGNDIHLAPGQEKHLPHEAWHVVQQKQGRVRPTAQLKGKVNLNDDAGLEREADLMGAKALNLTSFAGNQAPLQTKSLSETAPVQRVTTQISMDSEDGKIDKVSIVGRPDSAHSGTMGDHSTAFTTLAAGLNVMMEGKGLKEVYYTLMDLYSALKKLPGYSLINNLPLESKKRINKADDELAEWLDIGYTRFSDRTNLGEKLMPFTGYDVTLLQSMVDAYLEIRELIPLSTINTKAYNAALAGKGKGETARNLVHSEQGQGISFNNISTTILGLFDARSAAVVGTVTDQKEMDKIAPGVLVSDKGEDRITMMVDQHLITIQTMYPATWKKLKKEEVSQIRQDLFKAVKVKIAENKEVQETGIKIKSKRGGGNTAVKKYVATALNVDEKNIIRGVKIEGRTPSPFSGTMGAHTTAWVVLTQRMNTKLVGLHTLKAAGVLKAFGEKAEDILVEASQIFQADTKQIQKIIWSLGELGRINSKLEKMENMSKKIEVDKVISPYQQVLILQEAINCILDLQNLTPGASLYVGNVNGAREGAYRGILVRFLNKELVSKKEVRKACLGLLDLKGLDEHLSTIKETINSEKKGKERRKLESEYYTELLTQNDLPKPDFEKSVVFLMKHHFEMVESAFPGALAYAEVTKDEKKFFELAKESLIYANDDEFKPDKKD